MERAAVEDIKLFLAENLEIVVESESNYSPGNSQRVGLKFRGDDKCFTWETIFVPEE